MIIFARFMDHLDMKNMLAPIIGGVNIVAIEEAILELTRAMQ